MVLAVLGVALVVSAGNLTTCILLLLVLCSAGGLTPEEVEKVMHILEDPQSFNIPLWFLNRQKDWTSGKNFQNYGAQVAISLRDDLERLKKIR